MKKTVFRLCTALVCTAFMTASAPCIPERQEFETDADVPLSAKLVFPSAEARCLLTTNPRKGILHLSSDGTFIYTPDAGRRGRDYFGYRLESPSKELSEEATVLLRINRPYA